MPAGFGNFSVSACYPGIQEYLAGRVVANATMAEWIRKAVLELSGSYDFQGLQVVGPYVNLTPFVNQYNPSFFLQAGDNLAEVRKVHSLFLYYNPLISNPPAVSNLNNTNAGINLKYRSIGSIQQTLNIGTIPGYWGRYAGQIFIAPSPQYAYLCYLLYSKAHPFPNAGGANAGNDTIYLDDDWQDIVEYAAAYRGAISLRLLDYAAQYRQILYGDPKAVDAGGRRIDLGLIYSRTSQYERDSTTATRSLQIRRS
jgi:hypothetical protein